MEALARHTMCMPALILERPRLGALGAASDPVASTTMAEVPRRKAPSVESEVEIMNGFVDSAAAFRVIWQVAAPASVIKQHRAVAVRRRATPASVGARDVVESVPQYFKRVPERGRRR